jgi:hypothetical protein
MVRRAHHERLFSFAHIEKTYVPPLRLPERRKNLQAEDIISTLP